MQEKNRDFLLIKKRIFLYLDYKGIKKKDFYTSTGVSSGVLSQKNGLSEENILRFIFGKGPMLKTDNSAPETKEDKIYKELLERKEQELREAYKEIGQLQARLEDLNKDKTNKDTHYKRGKNAS